MVDEFAFYGIRNAQDVATCLAGYDRSTYPRNSDWTFTKFYLPRSVDSGYQLVDDAQVLWDAFASLHNKSGLPGKLEIPMESFTRAVEIVLKESQALDELKYRPAKSHWAQAVRNSGYVQARIAIGRTLSEFNHVA